MSGFRLTAMRMTVVCRGCGAVIEHTHPRGEFVEHHFVCPSCGPLESPYAGRTPPKSKRARDRRLTGNGNDVLVSFRVEVNPRGHTER